MIIAIVFNTKSAKSKMSTLGEKLKTLRAVEETYLKDLISDYKTYLISTITNAITKHSEKRTVERIAQRKVGPYEITTPLGYPHLKEFRVIGLGEKERIMSEIAKEHNIEISLIFSKNQPECCDCDGGCDACKVSVQIREITDNNLQHKQ